MRWNISFSLFHADDIISLMWGFDVNIFKIIILSLFRADIISMMPAIT